MSALFTAGSDLPDPRRWPAAPPTAASARLHAEVEARLAAAAEQAAAALDARIDAALAGWLRANDAAALDDALATAPSPAAVRHLWRRLAVAEAAVLRGDTLAAVLFAIPLVVVAGGGAAETSLLVPGTVAEPAALAHALAAHGMPLASARFALAPALVGAAAIAPAALPGLLARARAMITGGNDTPALDLAPAPIAVHGAIEQAHLRFLVGAAVAGPDADPFAAPAAPGWGMAAARTLSAAFAQPGMTLLALPRAPLRLAAALPAGRAAQREVALQLFAAGALRELRSRHGEPVAVISAHVAPDAPGGGELRLSLSSPFDVRSARGFRFPLAPWERVAEAVEVLTRLLEDCRVADVRLMPGVQPDRDPGTGLVRFARADASTLQ